MQTRGIARLLVQCLVCMSTLNCALISGGKNYPRTRSSAASLQQNILACSGFSSVPAWLLHASAAQWGGHFWNYPYTVVGMDSCYSLSLQPGISSFELSCCSKNILIFSLVDRHRSPLMDCSWMPPVQSHSCRKKHYWAFSFWEYMFESRALTWHRRLQCCHNQHPRRWLRF